MIYFIILGLVTFGFGLYRDDARIFIGLFILGTSLMIQRAEEVVTFHVCKTDTQTFAPAYRHEVDTLKKVQPDLVCEDVKMSRRAARLARKLVVKSR